MNKEKFISTLMEKLNIDKNTAIIINNIIENNNIFIKKNKDKIINEIMDALKIDLEKANNIYETTMNIIATTIKNKLKNPFKSID